MASYVLSRAAENDITEIARGSLTRWGVARAERYILDLHDAFQRLAEFPDIGRDVDDIRPGYFRFEKNRHVVFYQKADTGILIVRVLHERMDVQRHL